MRKDILIGALIGFLTGVFLIPTFINNEIRLAHQNLILLLGFPVLSGLGTAIARKIGERIKIIWQLAKFALTGVFNAAIDFGILNILIALTGVFAGIGYALFKSASFIVANINSFFWNRKWTFEERGRRGRHEYLRFLTISIGGLLINVGVASFIVNLVEPTFGLDLKQWANVGAAAGAVAGLLWNFLGYKLVVFRRAK